MAEGSSIINLGDLARPATVLVEKVSNAIGILYEPKRIIKKAEAEAEAKKIETIAGIELSDIQQRGIERLVYQEAKKQENLEVITAEAIRQLPPHANAGDLEEDWLVHFFDKCDKVSDKQMQSLWSRLLVGEATAPGSYSKRTVNIVASMNKEDADLFTNLCTFMWHTEQPTLFIYDYSDNVYKDNGVYFGVFKHLDAIGLISFEFSSGYMLRLNGKEISMSYFDKNVHLEFDKDEENSLDTGTVLFTQSGEELSNLCGAQASPEYFKHACEELSKQVASLNIINESD